MSYDSLGQGALDYLPCRYGASKLQFRGPRRRLEGDYITFLGGTETYGKFIESPYPERVEEQLGLTCVNFGWPNAGADAFLNDAAVPEICAGARVTVVQVMGAQNMSNRFYAVHPRRNDRFLRTSSLMKTVFHDMDFTAYNFTRHLLVDLKANSTERYDILVQELRDAWLARMTQLLKKIEGRTVLLWFADHSPDDIGAGHRLGSDPLFVDRTLIEQIRPFATQIVEVTASDAALEAGTQGMVFNPLEAKGAEELMGPAAHQEAADALTTVLEKMAQR